MASLKDTKRRIGSVKNTQKITRAMKLVSAAKFARANQAVVAARPYAKALQAMVSRLFEANQGTVDTPFLKEQAAKKVVLIVVSSDRGLCGGLNTQLLKAAGIWVEEQKKAGVSVELWSWGKRAGMWSRKRSEKTTQTRERVTDKPKYEFAASMAEDLIKAFESGAFDHVYIAFSEFRSAMTQTPKVAQLIPFKTEPSVSAKSEPKVAIAANGDSLLEPTFEVLLPVLIRKALATSLLRIFLEAAASEHGARMSAMDSATNNAKEVIKKLTLQYNRARQAAITKELIEIISGAEAL